VQRSTLAEANEARDWRIAEFAQHLIPDRAPALLNDRFASTSS